MAVTSTESAVTLVPSPIDATSEPLMWAKTKMAEAPTRPTPTPAPTPVAVAVRLAVTATCPPAFTVAFSPIEEVTVCWSSADP